jgi:hypothetical protein
MNLTVQPLMSQFKTSQSIPYYLPCEPNGPTVTVSGVNLTVQPLVSIKNLTVHTLLPPLWTSDFHHYCEAYAPMVNVSDVNLTAVPLCTSGRRTGYKLGQRIAAERRQRGGP